MRSVRCCQICCQMADALTFALSVVGSNYLKTLAPRAGFEPATNRLTVTSTTIACGPLQLGAQASMLKFHVKPSFSDARRCTPLHPSAL